MTQNPPKRYRTVNIRKGLLQACQDLGIFWVFIGFVKCFLWLKWTVSGWFAHPHKRFARFWSRAISFHSLVGSKEKKYHLMPITDCSWFCSSPEVLTPAKRPSSTAGPSLRFRAWGPATWGWPGAPLRGPHLVNDSSRGRPCFLRVKKVKALRTTACGLFFPSIAFYRGATHRPTLLENHQKNKPPPETRPAQKRLPKQLKDQELYQIGATEVDI